VRVSSASATGVLAVGLAVAIAAACVVGVVGAVVGWLVARFVATVIEEVVEAAAVGAAVPLSNVGGVVVGLGEPQAASIKQAAITAHFGVYKLGIVLLSPLSLCFLLGLAAARQVDLRAVAGIVTFVSR
jgi:hypothetical protein